MHKKTILCFTIETGIAHLTRTLAIAEVLHKRGHRVIFAVDRSFHHIVKKQGISVVHLTPCMWGKGSLTESVERLKDSTFTSKLIKEEMILLQKYKPDIALVDLRPTALVAAYACHTKTVFLTGSGGLPFGSYIANFGIPHRLHQLLYPLIGSFAWKVKRTYLESVVHSAKKLGVSIQLDDLILNSDYIVPEVEGYLPQLNKKLHIHYVGPIIWNGFQNERPLWLSKIKRTGKTIYISFGGTGFDKHKLVDLSTYLVDHGYTVVVSASSIADTAEFPKKKNLFVTKYIDGDEICRRVDAVICHGGYGTMMQAIRNGTPVISIPYNPDQFIHALRVAELGFGRTLTRFSLGMILNFSWDIFQKIGEQVSIATINKTLEEVLKKRVEYEKSISQFSSSLKRYTGTEQAAAIIEKL